eukprot:5568072-Pyramimonas_sp.AAC.1
MASVSMFVLAGGGTTPIPSFRSVHNIGTLLLGVLARTSAIQSMRPRTVRSYLGPSAFVFTRGGKWTPMMVKT